MTRWWVVGRGWAAGRGSWGAGTRSRVVAGLAALVVLAAIPAAAQQAASPLQGFSIVLVQGDMAASDGRSSLPEAAARAVGDMKGLLPFRSYHLVDSAWVLADSASGLINARLKGPDNVSYDVVMEALASQNGAQRVAFRLRESGGEVSPEARAMERDLATLNTIVSSLREKYEAAVRSQPDKGGGGVTTEFLRTQMADAERRAAALRQGIAAESASQGSAEARALARTERLRQSIDEERVSVRRQEEELAALSEKFNPNHPDISARQRRLDLSRRRLDQRLGDEQLLAIVPVPARSSAPAGSTLIETMFTMRLGETVVVGTSRTGVDKALVAVLTAVPQQKGRGGF